MTGKYWIAECSYLYSPDKDGWDDDIYKYEKD